jgi:hypothetical protein
MQTNATTRTVIAGLLLVASGSLGVALTDTAEEQQLRDDNAALRKYASELEAQYHELVTQYWTPGEPFTAESKVLFPTGVVR